MSAGEIEPGTRPCLSCAVVLTAAEGAGHTCPVCGGRPLSDAVEGIEPGAAAVVYALRRIAAAIEANIAISEDDEPEPPEPEPWRSNPRRRRPS